MEIPEHWKVRIRSWLMIPIFALSMAMVLTGSYFIFVSYQLQNLGNEWEFLGITFRSLEVLDLAFTTNEVVGIVGVLAAISGVTLLLKALSRGRRVPAVS